MSNKQKAIMDKFEGLMKKMSDEELEKLLLVGEGMVIMSGIKEKSQLQKNRKLGDTHE